MTVFCDAAPCSLVERRFILAAVRTGNLTYEGKIPLGRPRFRCEDNITTDFEE
jgi:hypothetical protein